MVLDNIPLVHAGYPTRMMSIHGVWGKKVLRVPCEVLVPRSLGWLHSTSDCSWRWTRDGCTRGLEFPLCICIIGPHLGGVEHSGIHHDDHPLPRVSLSEAAEGLSRLGLSVLSFGISWLSLELWTGHI